MLLADGLGLHGEAALLRASLDEALRGEVLTADMGGSASCSAMGAEVRRLLEAKLGARDAHVALMASNRGCVG